jgi:hypothetical protein
MSTCLMTECKQPTDVLVADRTTRSVEARCSKHAQKESDKVTHYPVGGDGLPLSFMERYAQETRGFHVRTDAQ